KSIVQSGGQQIGQGIHDQKVLRSEGVLSPALNIEYSQQAVPVGDRQAKRRLSILQYAHQLPFGSILCQYSFIGARHTPHGADAQRYSPAQGLGGSAGFGLDFDVLGGIVENADANVVKLEIFLN